jgi:hypothetical protein
LPHAQARDYHHIMPGLHVQFIRRRAVLTASFVAAAGVVPLLHAQKTGDLPNPAELLVQTALPDPLVMLDGQKVTTREMWFKERRPELIRLFQHYMYGRQCK